MEQALCDIASQTKHLVVYTYTPGCVHLNTWLCTPAARWSLPEAMSQSLHPVGYVLQQVQANTSVVWLPRQQECINVAANSSRLKALGTGCPPVCFLYMADSVEVSSFICLEKFCSQTVAAV